MNVLGEDESPPLPPQRRGNGLIWSETPTAFCGESVNTNTGIGRQQVTAKPWLFE